MKENTTVLEEVKARMKELHVKKLTDLEAISKMQEEARSKIEAAVMAMKKATEEMDVDAYEEAKTAKRKANTALEMYKSRYEQIAKQELISEAESDQVIDSLLQYENQLTDQFKAGASTLLKQLDELLTGYREEIRSVETTLTTWQRDIHANHKATGTIYYDQLTGEPTNRSPRPVPVHQREYWGCPESYEMFEYLDKAKGLYKAE